jgi:hypothetical protein
MANTQAMCTSFMKELMLGNQNLASGGNTFYAALYLVSATIDAATTVYTVTGEVSGTGYSAGGIVVPNTISPLSTNSSPTAGVAYWTPSASLVYSTVTLTTAFDAVLLYNLTNSNKAVSVHKFGSQTITAGTFTLTMPINATGSALLRLATV